RPRRERRYRRARPRPVLREGAVGPDLRGGRGEPLEPTQRELPEPAGIGRRTARPHQGGPLLREGAAARFAREPGARWAPARHGARDQRPPANGAASESQTAYGRHVRSWRPLPSSRIRRTHLPLSAQSWSVSPNCEGRNPDSRGRGTPRDYI